MQSPRLYVDELRRVEIPPPVASRKGWEQVEASSYQPQLVEIGSGAGPYPQLTAMSVYAGRLVSSIYPKGLEGSLNGVWLPRESAECLLVAEQIAPEGYHLVVVDGYRPHAVQTALYEHVKKGIANLKPHLSEEECATYAQQYVSLPTADAPHQSGAADLVVVKVLREVDGWIRRIDEQLLSTAALDYEQRQKLALAREHLLRRFSTALDVGVPFDYAGEEASPRFFEQTKGLSTQQKTWRDNRRIQHGIITSARWIDKAGGEHQLVVRDNELWHVDPSGSKMGAKSLGRESALWSHCAPLPETGIDFAQVQSQPFDNAQASGLLTEVLGRDIAVPPVTRPFVSACEISASPVDLSVFDA